MKIRKKQTEEEKEEGKEPEEGTEEETEEEEEEEVEEEKEGEEKGEEESEEAKSFINKKVTEIIQALKDAPVRKKITREEPTLFRSVIETDPTLRKTRPFVKLSKEMEAFVKDIKIIANGGVPQSIQKSVMGDDTLGGFLVPSEFHAEVIRYATENAIVRPRARVFPMATDILDIPTLDQSADHFAGVSLSYVGENVAAPRTRPRFGKIVLNTRQLVGLCDVSRKMLQNSAIDITNFLVGLFGEALKYAEDRDFLTGVGVNRPLGIIRDLRVPTITRTTASRITITDVTRMYEELPAYATPNSVWITTKRGVGQLMRMRADAVTAGDSAGAMLFQPSMQVGAPNTLLGKSILETDKLPAVGTRGDILLGDLRYYFIGDKGPIQVASSIHEKFGTGETVLRFIKDFDGQPAIPSAFIVLN